MNRADLEFYESDMLLKAAKALVPDGRDWDECSHTAKNNYLNRAGDVLLAVINDEKCLQRLSKIAEQSCESNNQMKF